MANITGKKARKQQGGNKYHLHRVGHSPKRKDKQFPKTVMKHRSTGEYKVEG